MKVFGLLCAWFAIMATTVAASAAPALQLGIQSAFTVPLGCEIRDQKLIVITNTSGAAITNTNVTYDAIRMPDGKHYGQTKKVTFLAAGGILQIGGDRSYSCTAWFKRVPLLTR